MPPSPRAAALTEAHRVAQVRLSAQTQALSNAAWRLLDPARVGATSERWMRLMGPIIRRQRQLSAGLSGDYYQRLRALQLESGDVLPALATTITDDEIDGTLARTVVDRLENPPAQPWEMTVRNARNAAARSAARMALNGGRRTVLNTVQADRLSLGWTRVGRGEPCAFCRLAISRGPVYRSESSADFHAHDGCHCAAAPAFLDEDLWTDQAEREADVYYAAVDEARAAGEYSRGTSNDSLNALRRYLSANA